MKNEDIKIGIKEIQNIKMTASEKENILKSVLNFSIPDKKPIHSPYSFVSIFQRNHFTFYATLSMLLIILGGSGTIIGSQKSLPGNALYPIKTSLVEPLNSALKLSSEKKAQYELSLVKERVQETQILASRGELDKAKEEKVKTLIETHKDAFSKAIEEIKQTGPTEEIVATTAVLENEMEENVQILAVATEQVAEENIENQNGETIAMAKPAPEIEINEIDSSNVAVSENTNTDIKNKEVAQMFDSGNEKQIESVPLSGQAIMPMATNTEISSENNNDSQKYVDISLPLFTKWFEQISSERGDVLYYTINDIVFVASKENVNETENSFFSKEDSNNAFIVSVSYSVQTTKEGKRNYWLAGNGRDRENGWVLNKSMFLTIDKENGAYYIKNMGTGI